ncbi:MAG: tail protein X [Burkholderiales bacterium]|nr:tail protein X [Burkholderiales bacterium]
MIARTLPAFGSALVASGLAVAASAVPSGDLRVHSFLGEPLDATAPLEAAAGGIPRAECFRQAHPDGAALPSPPRASFRVERDGEAWRLRIRTRAAVVEPALALRVDAGCPGEPVASRTYEILLDPRPAEAPSPPLVTVAGDSLASIATAIYPRGQAVRDAYVGAIRAANPAVAALGAQDPIPPGTAITLPELRRFSLSLAATPPAPRATPPASPRPAAPKAAPAPKATPAPVPKATPAPVPKASPPAAPKAAPPAAPRAVPPAPPPRDTAKAGEFVLRLSAPAVDLTRSRGIDDRTRAQLRERLLILDADDQVSALLAMRNSLRQLEGRVAELQLKLSTLPSSMPAPAPAPPAAKPEPAPPAAKPEPAPPAAKSEPVPVPAPAPPPAEPKRDPAPAPQPPPAPAAAEAPKAAKPTQLAPAAKPAVSPAAAPGAAEDGVPAWLWAVLALVVAGIAGIAWKLASGRRKPAAPVTATATPPAHSDLDDAAAMMETTSPPAPEHRVVAQSDSTLSTNVPGADPVMLRRRYIEERFPEIASGTIAPADPDSVVKAARLFYEDGALARAVELLQFAVEENPRTLKPWLALFEIFRLEGLSGAFGELAGRFRVHHGASDYWRKVQFIGRELEPGNALYIEAAVDHLETIGPAAARNVAPVTFDPLAENWLNAPMDFTTDALAASLRAGLLGDAGIAETDLVADPMPALKNVEMFTVA